MCLAVYLASETQLPLIPWSERAPGLWVSDDIPDRAAVRRQLTGPHLHLIGTHTGCGCGFLYAGLVPGMPEYVETRSLYRDLSEYLRIHAERQVVEIYTCWGGDEGADPDQRRRVGVAEIDRDGFALQERELLSVDVAP